MSLEHLLIDARGCTECATHLPHGTRPIVQAAKGAKILIAGQAPGRRVHESGIPFDDASGDRLRDWMGIDRETFYNADKVAILPMGFCYPGTGKSGDLPPRSECAPLWRQQLLDHLPHIELTLVIGTYAMDWHLPARAEKTLTDTVKNWRHYPNNILPLPHPSPRNNIWLKKNPWFEPRLVPILKARCQRALSG